MGAEVVAWDDNAGARAPRPAADGAARSVRGRHGDATRWCCRPAFRIRCRRRIRSAARARAAGVPILSDAELLFQAVRAAGSRARFAGITGTNGKSTTTALLAHILAGAGVPVAAGGNLGPAALACRCCPMTASMCWRCRPTCWSDSPRSASMRRRCSISVRRPSGSPWRHGRLCRRQARDLRRGRRTQRPRGDRHRRCAVARHGGIAATAALHDLRRQPADIWCDATACCATPTGRSCAWRDARALPGAHNAQNAAAAAAMALALGVAARDDRARHRELSRPAAPPAARRRRSTA